MIKKFSDFIKKIINIPAGSAGANIAIFYILQKSIQLVGNIALARLLAPSVFGEMAIINTLIIGLSLLSDVGIAQSIIRHPDEKNSQFMWTMWSIQIVRGFVLYLFIVLLSFPASNYYSLPGLASFMSVAGLVLVVQGFRATWEPLAYKNFKVKNLLIGKVISQIANLVVSGFFAWHLNNVWALVIGLVVSSIVDVLCGYVLLNGVSHRLHFNKLYLNEFSKYGRWILLSTGTLFLSGQGISLVQGGYVDSATLGLLAIAGVLSWIIGELISKFLESVGYPLLAKSYNLGLDQLGGRLNTLQLYLVGVGGLLFFGLAIASEFIVSVLYDARYSAAGDYLSIFAISGIFTIYSMCLSKALQACGKVNIEFYVNFFFSCIRIFVVIVSLRFLGILPMIWAIVLTNIFQSSFSFFVQSKIIGRVYSINIAIHFLYVIVSVAFYLFWS